MRHLTDEEIEQLKPSEKYEWVNKEITAHSYSSSAGGGTFTLPDLKDYREGHLMFQCLRCHSHYLLDECQNCSATAFCTGPGGVFCVQCERGFTEWKCSECGTDNPAKRTLFLLQKKGGCFIATAVYGSYDAPEVRVLRLVRDTMLVDNIAGRQLVRAYYFASPPLARVIERHRHLRQLIRAVFLQPIVELVQRRLGEK